LLGVREGESPQDDRVDDGELGSCAADAQAEDKHGQKTKRFVFEQYTQPDSNVLSK
jgi:hypothetical protein